MKLRIVFGKKTMNVWDDSTSCTIFFYLPPFPFFSSFLLSFSSTLFLTSLHSQLCSQETVRPRDLFAPYSNQHIIRLFIVQDIPLCLKYINTNTIYIYIYIYVCVCVCVCVCVYSVWHNNAFIASVATSFGPYDHHQANVIQNLQRLATYSA